MPFGILERGPDFSFENCKTGSLKGRCALTQITL